jgi:hypothetical protein
VEKESLLNVFRTIASGKHAFREEFVSAFLAYLLSPKMDHGLGYSFLSRLLYHVAENNGIAPLKDMVGQLRSMLWENIFDDSVDQPVVELEFSIPGGFIDIVIRCGDWFVLVENKILSTSKTNGQLKTQYEGFIKTLQDKNLLDGKRILVLYVVPGAGTGDEWTVSPDFFAELETVQLRTGDFKALVSWQPNTDSTNYTPSIVGTIRDILADESLGKITPIDTEVRHTLLSLIDFVLGDFQGFHYRQATSKKATEPKIKVREALLLDGDQYIGIQYGRGGLVSAAWRNNKFLDREVIITDDSTRGWHYLPLRLFKQLTEWAISPESNTLNRIVWDKSPFFTQNLYRVAKYGKGELFIGIRGGVKALELLTAEQIDSRKVWELSSEQRSSDWIDTGTFCSILEGKGLSYT